MFAGAGETLGQTIYSTVATYATSSNNNPPPKYDSLFLGIAPILMMAYKCDNATPKAMEKESKIVNISQPLAD